ncbi:MAG TPA: hypothetical protein VL285_00380, partial [Bryobacteraceae bacterium]|nr:hypothetical protein [Bryobacteraceae bacterium]
MSRAVLILAFLSTLASAEERWIWLHSDGFELFTDAGARAGRAELVRLEQFRYALGTILGKPDLAFKPPAQVLLFKSSKDAGRYAADGPIQVGRERLSLILAADAIPADLQARLARLLIDSNTDRMPADLERGLIALFSNLEVAGIRITLGKPLPGARPDKDWARMHMLAVDPQYYGKLPVLFYNLRKGAEDDPAYRNAFGKSKAEIEAEVDRYLAAGNFPTSSPSSRAMSAERDFPAKPLEPHDIPQKLAELLKERQQMAEYRSLIEQARKDPRETAALERAIGMEPNLAEPRLLLAQREPDAHKRIEMLKAAIALDRRQAPAWKALAETYASLHQFAESAKAWHAAEQAETTPEGREKMRRARLDVERQRLDFEDAEKKRIADENARELQKLKNEEIARLRALEARVNQSAGGPPAQKAEPWWNGPNPEGKVQG